MIVFVHQPEFVPWLGFFDKLARCDTFVIYDDVQYQHGGFHNRNRIRTMNGWEWLTVPIVHGHPQIIKNVKIAGAEWKTKQLTKIEQNYQKTTFFRDYFPLLRKEISVNHDYLMHLNLGLIQAVAELLEIKVKMVRSSEFPYCGREKNEKLVAMCKHLGADTYLSGSGGKSYLEETLFNQAKIKVQWHSYNHPTYKQVFNSFEPNMSIIDLLFNAGTEAKNILLTGGRVYEKNESNLLALPQPLIAQSNLA
jgi:hypothetical protein